MPGTEDDQTLASRLGGDKNPRQTPQITQDKLGGAHEELGAQASLGFRENRFRWFGENGRLDRGNGFGANG